MIGELLSKSWIDTAIPVMFLVLVITVFGTIVPGFFDLYGLSDIARQFGEVGFISIGLAIVILSGGIDLSVGAVFGLCNFVALALIQGLGVPIPLGIALSITLGGAIGLVNGILVGFFRLRAFLTTLVTLIITRAVLESLVTFYGDRVIGEPENYELWEYLGEGAILGFPLSFVVMIAAAVFFHIFLTRMRIGWHVQAVGGSRRSAHNAGINVRAIVCLGYVISGTCAGIAASLYAARLTNAGADVGNGMEILALTAVVLGGNSLGGGRGSVSKALIGAITVLLITNSIISLGLRSGGTNLVLGLILLLAVVVDVRWIKNRSKILSRVYISPTYFKMPSCPATDRDSSTVFAMNDMLANAEPIGLDMVDGAEDVIFDSKGHLYTGSRHGNVMRFSAPSYDKPEIFAHIGGATLGFAIDQHDTLHVCVSGMGLYSVDQSRTVRKLSDQTNRSMFSIRDDSRIRFADDLDIADDGRVYYSEATVRFDIYEWASDSLEMRGNGRILCYDPKNGSTRTVLKNLIFPNGICMAHDGESLLFAETWACRVSRYWFGGRKAGTVEIIADNLPGYPDNINRASDGTFWVALLGMRTQALDLALEMPDFRKRMAQRVAFDEWIYPNLNTGTVLKMTLDGEVLYSLWDSAGETHPMITSMREHEGHLYLGGIFNNRIGKIALPDADPAWSGPRSYWGGRQ
ncbi:hypothetical protein N184_31475 [Sinorhizobium sp. GL28]|nr:hypothetical protein N184_31475 [Sinorhizobium sp. GL28]